MIRITSEIVPGFTRHIIIIIARHIRKSLVLTKLSLLHIHTHTPKTQTLGFGKAVFLVQMYAG